jgi:HSP20 family protein
MRLFAATSLLFLTARPAVTHGFHVAGRPAVTRSAVTSLDARRSLFPVLRRGFAFPDVDRVFDEMDELMETSFSTRFPRPALSPTIKGFPEDLRLRRPLGFDVTQDDKQYKVAVHVPDVSAEDVDLQLDHDGRVLRLKGERSHEEGGMKVCSRFEKAILLSPDVDTTKLAANMSGDTLTVVAPKIEKKEALDHAENKKIEIKVVGPPEAALQDDTPKAPTRLAVENLKQEEKVDKPQGEGEAKWPARDFPY